MIKLKLAIVALFIVGTQQVFSQENSISGTVTDETGLPLPGATVVVKGTSNGASTDFDGMYIMNNVKPSDRIIFSYVGMQTVEIVVGDQTKIDVSLDPEAASLDEVVVVGYGTQSRVNVTGAISTVELTDLNEIPPVTNAESALQGRAAGLSISNSGVPGSSPSVNIRGLTTINGNQPIYVIDGVIVGNLSGLNPNDIESVSVLKDAATTAVYGAQGSNGVIVVTTKKGKKGRGNFNFNTYTGFQVFNKRLDVLDNIDHLNYISQEFGIFPARSLEELRNNTDWQDAIFRTGFIQDYNVSYSGGGETGSYLLSAGLQDNEGVIINTGFKRYSFRASGDKTVGKLKMGQTMSIAFGKQTPERQGGGRTLIEHALKSAPYLPVFNPNNPGGFQGPNNALDGQDAENAVRIQTLGSSINTTLGIIGNIYGEYEILNGLTFKSQVSLDYFRFDNRSFTPSFDDDNLRGVSNGTHSSTFSQIGRLTQLGRTIQFNNSLRYYTSINDIHNIEVLGLVEKFDNKFSQFGVGSRNSVTNEVEQLVNDETLTAGSFEVSTERLGFLGRINYDYDGKYLFAASFRRDSSTRFGQNKKWGNFYSVALGWNVAEESFMEDTAFSTLKFRGSYGLTGLDNIGNYRFSPELVQGFQYVFDDQIGNGTTQNGNENLDLQWEEKTILNVGMDVGLFNQKFTAAIEYFVNTSDRLLIDIQTPLSNGNNSNSQAVNLGKSEAKGFEVTLGYNDNQGDFKWSANLNLSTTRAEMKSIAGQEEVFFNAPGIRGGGIDGQISRVAVGEPLFHFYGFESDGIYSNQAEVDASGIAGVQPGDVRYIDQNGDGVINDAEDRVIIGDPSPDIIAGLDINMNYKNFDFGFLLSGFYGNDIFNTNTIDLTGVAGRGFNVGRDYFENRWTPENTNGTQPRSGANPISYAVSDRYVEDGSFTRLRSLTLGYTLPSDMFKESFSKLRVYVSGQNLITWTNYSGLDPELPLTNDVTPDVGIDRGRYPQAKSFLLGLQVSF
ncbi:SusC/RagA family TonB-linked outer membrane protein [Aquimarina algiphila]|uniref:SusC/RagA family TonB-linked outer membrane protein n=1 Tax=Aquimarina algiphila TaxID=2047982 RepID=UPI002491D7E3|nr:TonB-dependent receptor [Aquimarina algiphila]